jgi:hypothetical protein
MDEDTWKDLMRVASVVAEEVIERSLNPVYDRDKINEITRDRIHFFKEIKKMLERLREEIDTQEEPDPIFCEELKQFLTNLTEKNQQIFLSAALSTINTEALGEFLERYGIQIWTDYPKNHSFEIIVIIVPRVLDSRRIFAGEFVKTFGYIKIGEKVFDFDSNLFERLAKGLVHTENIGGTDESLGIELSESELEGGVSINV